MYCLARAFGTAAAVPGSADSYRTSMSRLLRIGDTVSQFGTQLSGLAVPVLAVADGHIAVTDPRHSLVRIVDVESLKEERTIAVEGQPFTIVAVGGSGASH